MLNGIFFEVHNELGNYCREIQYCDAIENILKERELLYKREVCLKSENNIVKNNSNRVDFVVDDVESELMSNQTTSAFSMTTASTGTSENILLRPVLTARIASTTSSPSETLPNTA